MMVPLAGFTKSGAGNGFGFLAVLDTVILLELTSNFFETV